MSRFTNGTMVRLTTGACVELQGALIESPGKEQAKELQVNHIKVLGECDTVKYMRVSFMGIFFTANTSLLVDIPTSKETSYQ